jgi:hypothetical protein
MYTNYDLIRFGNFLLNKAGIEHKEITLDVVKEWKNLTKVGLKASKLNAYIDHNITKAENGGLLFFEHKGETLSKPIALLILKSAKAVGYVLVADIPDQFVDEILERL